MYLDLLISSATRTALLSGGFALAGVLLATAIGLLTAHLQRKWAVEDRDKREKQEAQLLLRTDRLGAYAVLLERFVGWEMAVLDLDEGDPDELQQRYDAAYADHAQPAEAALRRARLLADPELEQLLIKYDKAIERVADLGFTGVDLDPSHADDFQAVRTEIFKAMQDEIRLDKVVS